MFLSSTATSQPQRTPMSNVECYTCYSLTNKRCGGCKKAFFCSPSCQKMLWRTHKLHCHEIDSPIFIRQPKFTMQEFNLMMSIVRVDDLPEVTLRKAWKICTESEKQGVFEAYVAELESYGETQRHEVLIGCRNSIIECLVGGSISESSLTAIAIELKLAGLQSFYDMTTFEKEGIGIQIEEHRKLSILLFNYFSLDSTPQTFVEEAKPLTDEAVKRVVTETLYLQKNRVKNWKAIKTFIFEVVLQIGEEET